MSYEGPTVPINSKINEIVDFINANERPGIKAPTGSGKSIGIPAALAETQKKVYVALPNRGIINSMVISQGIFNPHLDIGILDENLNMTDNVSIVYSTSNLIEKKILSGIKDGKFYDMTFCDYLILDEIHTGISSNYIIIGLIDQFKKAKFRVPKLIIMSANIPPDGYRDFSIMEFKDTGAYGIKLVYHSIEYEPGDNKRYRIMADLINQYHTQIQDTSTFLVFLPGKREIEQVARSLVDLKGVEIIQIHSTTIRDNIKRVYSRNVLRKIILSTNIFETAITIEGVSFVLDSMLEKKASTGRLTTDFISKTSADQRKGRTGRTREGICYRMITEGDYETLPNEKPEEIYQIDLSKVVISLLKVGVYPLDILPQAVRSKMRPLIGNLKKLGLIKEDNTISDMGAFYTEFRLSLEAYSVLWWLLNTTNDLYYGLVVVSIINNITRQLVQFEFGNNLSPIEFQASVSDYRRKYYEKFIGRSDIHTYINIWREYQIFTGGLDSPQSLIQWTETNKLNTKNFSELHKVFSQLISQLPEYGYVINSPTQVGGSTDEIIDKIRPIVRKVYSDSEMILIDKDKMFYITNKSGEDKTRFGISIIPRLNTYSGNPPELLIPLSIRETLRGGKMIEISLSIDHFQIDDKLVTDASLLAGYSIKMSRRGRANVSNIITLPRFPFAINFGKMDDKPEVVPKLVEQNYIEIGKSKILPIV